MAAVEDDQRERMSLDERKERINELKARAKEIATENADIRLTDEQRSEWNAVNEEIEQHERIVAEKEAMIGRLKELEGDESRTEKGASFNTNANHVRGDDIYDLSTVRMSSPIDAAKDMRDRAMRSVEASTFPHERADQADTKKHVERLLNTVDSPQTEGLEINANAGALARRILVTGSPLYRRAFGKYLGGRGLNPEEQRALSLGTGSAGGFAVVYQLDPTVVPTSNFSVNPYRAIARIENITGTNEWKAITSGAITAAYAAEATEASDNAPTLAQPDIIVEKAQAFVPFSIELGQDWGALQAEMANLLQDAKDDLEATKFATGAGHGSNEPKGIITAATATTTAGGTASIAIADLYKVLEALPARFRPRAQWVGNLFTVDKIRQFDTAGGSGVWIDGSATPDLRGLGPQADAGTYGTLAGGSGIPKLLGRNFWESTGMASALTTGSKVLLVGDFRYFVIVERVGMDIEILPQLLGSNRRPTGQRGLYAYWRNSSDALSAAAFQVLVTG